MKMKNIRLQIKRIRTRLCKIYDTLRREAVYFTFQNTLPHDTFNSLDGENSEQAEIASIEEVLKKSLEDSKYADERAVVLTLIGEALAALEQI